MWNEQDLHANGEVLLQKSKVPKIKKHEDPKT